MLTKAQSDNCLSFLRHNGTAGNPILSGEARKIGFAKAMALADLPEVIYWVNLKKKMSPKDVLRITKAKMDEKS